MQIFRGHSLGAGKLNELEKAGEVFGLTIGRSGVKVLGLPWSEWVGCGPLDAPQLTTATGSNGLNKANLEAIAAGQIAYLTLGGAGIPGPYGSKRISHVLVPNSEEWRARAGVEE